MSANVETKSAFSRRVNLSRARVGQLVNEGLPVDDVGMVRIEDELAWMKRRLDPLKRAAVPPADHDGAGR